MHTTTPRQFVCIDAGVEDRQSLLSGISDDAVIHILSDASDGLQQVASLLAHEQNIAAFIVHLDELNPHIHCTLLPIKDSRFAYKEIFAGKDKFEYSARMKQLHTDFFAEVNTKWGMSRGTSISETGARHRTTEEYRRMLSEECTTIEDNIKLHQQVLGELQSDIRLAERRVKGLTTMVSNLEKQKTEKETLLSAAEYNLKENKGNAAELAIQIQMLEKELQGIIRFT